MKIQIIYQNDPGHMQSTPTSLTEQQAYEVAKLIARLHDERMAFAEEHRTTNPCPELTHVRMIVKSKDDIQFVITPSPTWTSDHTSTDKIMSALKGIKTWLNPSESSPTSQQQI